MLFEIMIIPLSGCARLYHDASSIRLDIAW